MTFDRTKFQGAKMSAQKDAQKSAKENEKGFGDSTRAAFINVVEGRNVFRMMPPHPDDKLKASYLPKRVSMLKCEVSYTKDSVVVTEIKNKNIFIATQHGGLPKDPIELYIDYVRKYALDAIPNKEERAKYISPITGWKGPKGWNWGINPKTSFVAYVISDGKLGRLELYEQWIQDMNKLSISEDPQDVIQVDPFSDPDEGFPIIITKSKAVDKSGRETGKWDYTVSKEEPKKIGGRYESYDDFFLRTAVTDAQLEELSKQEPLSTLYGNDVYNRHDWDLALDGLQRFDIENKYGIFDNEEFLTEIETLEKLVKEDVVEDIKQGKDIDKAFEKKPEDTKSKVVVEDHSQDEDQSEEEQPLTIPEMKLILKKFVTKHFGSQYADQVPQSKLDVQKWYVLYDEGEELPIVLEPEQKVTIEKVIEKVIVPKPKSIIEPEITEEPEEGKEVNPELDSEIAKLRARRAARKNG
jgi:hypothetical protein